MPIVLYFIAQLIALIALIELLVVCMPRALRRASNQNCYRVDGTLSPHRAFRERRARNRLRRDMIAVMVLVFLTGNALYFTIDSQCNVPRVLSYLTNRTLGGDPAEANRVLGEDVKASSGTRDASAEASFERFRAQLPWILSLTAVWIVGCAAVVGFGAMRAYREFAAGVNARAAEHFHLDMTRMSVSDADIAKELMQSSDSSPGAA